MKTFRILAAASAAAAAGGLAVPALAQSSYPYQSYPVQQAYPQYQYPQAYPQAYPGQPGYGYQQGYGQNTVGAIIGQLLGNRYNVTDRTAVTQCANAAMVQAQSQYRGAYGGQHAYPQGYGYAQGYGVPAMRVTSITDVQRRHHGLRVSGLMSSGYGGQYANQYGYQNRSHGDVSFRCNVDYRGQVTNVRIGRNNAYRG